MCKLKEVPVHHFAPLRTVESSFNCFNCDLELVAGDKYWAKQFSPNSIKGVCASCFNAMRFSVALYRNIRTKTPPKFSFEYIEILSSANGGSADREYLSVSELHELIGLNSSFLDVGVN